LVHSLILWKSKTNQQEHDRKVFGNDRNGRNLSGNAETAGNRQEHAGKREDRGGR
jgi:hypothetical protein